MTLTSLPAYALRVESAGESAGLKGLKTGLEEGTEPEGPAPAAEPPRTPPSEGTPFALGQIKKRMQEELSREHDSGYLILDSGGRPVRFVSPSGPEERQRTLPTIEHEVRVTRSVSGFPALNALVDLNTQWEALAKDLAPLDRPAVLSIATFAPDGSIRVYRPIGQSKEDWDRLHEACSARLERARPFFAAMRRELFEPLEAVRGNAKRLLQGKAKARQVKKRGVLLIVQEAGSAESHDFIRWLKGRAKDLPALCERAVRAGLGDEAAAEAIPLLRRRFAGEFKRLESTQNPERIYERLPVLAREVDNWVDEYLAAPVVQDERFFSRHEIQGLTTPQPPSLIPVEAPQKQPEAPDQNRDIITEAQRDLAALSADQAMKQKWKPEELKVFCLDWAESAYNILLDNKPIKRPDFIKGFRKWKDLPPTERARGEIARLAETDAENAGAVAAAVGRARGFQGTLPADAAARVGEAIQALEQRRRDRQDEVRKAAEEAEREKGMAPVRVEARKKAREILNTADYQEALGKERHIQEFLKPVADKGSARPKEVEKARGRVESYKPGTDIIRNQLVKEVASLLAPPTVDAITSSQSGLEEAVQPERVFRAHGNKVPVVVFHPDGRLLSAGMDQHIFIHNPGDGSSRPLAEKDGEPASMGIVLAAAVSPDGAVLAGGLQAGTVRLSGTVDGAERWHKFTTQISGKGEGHADDVLKAGFTPDGEQVVTIGKDRRLKVWRVSDGEMEGDFSVAQHPVQHADLNTRDGLAVVVDQRHLRAWMFGGGTCEPYNTVVLKEEAASLAAHPSQEIAAVALRGGAIELYELTEGTLTLTLQGHAQAAQSMAFSPSGQWLASGDASGKVFLWNAATGTQVAALEGGAGIASSLAFSPDGRGVAAGSSRGPVTLWRIPEELTRSVSAPAAQRDQPLAQREATPDEVDGYLLKNDSAGIRLLEGGQWRFEEGRLRGILQGNRSPEGLGALERIVEAARRHPGEVRVLPMAVLRRGIQFDSSNGVINFSMELLQQAALTEVAAAMERAARREPEAFGGLLAWAGQRLEQTRPPAVTQGPSGRSVAEGHRVTFSVAAEGAPPLSYQWQRNGADIPGARESSYELDAGMGDNGARFRCVVSNPAGTVVSSEAALTVAQRKAGKKSFPVVVRRPAAEPEPGESDSPPAPPADSPAPPPAAEVGPEAEVKRADPASVRRALAEDAALALEGRALPDQLIVRYPGWVGPAGPEIQVDFNTQSSAGPKLNMPVLVHLHHGRAPLVAILSDPPGRRVHARFAVEEMRQELSRRSPPLSEVSDIADQASEAEARSSSSALEDLQARVFDVSRKALAGPYGGRDELRGELGELQRQHPEMSGAILQAVEEIQRLFRQEYGLCVLRAQLGEEAAGEAETGAAPGREGLPVATVLGLCRRLADGLEPWERVRLGLKNLEEEMESDLARDPEAVRTLDDFLDFLKNIEIAVHQQRRVLLQGRADPAALALAYPPAIRLAMTEALEDEASSLLRGGGSGAVLTTVTLWMFDEIVSLEEGEAFNEMVRQKGRPSPDTFRGGTPLPVFGLGALYLRQSPDGDWRVRRHVRGGGAIGSPKILTVNYPFWRLADWHELGDGAVALLYPSFTGNPNPDQVDAFFEDWHQTQPALPGRPAVWLGTATPGGQVRLFRPTISLEDPSAWQTAYGQVYGQARAFRERCRVPLEREILNDTARQLMEQVKQGPKLRIKGMDPRRQMQLHARALTDRLDGVIHGLPRSLREKLEAASGDPAEAEAIMKNVRSVLRDDLKKLAGLSLQYFETVDQNLPGIVMRLSAAAGEGLVGPLERSGGFEKVEIAGLTGPAEALEAGAARAPGRKDLEGYVNQAADKQGWDREEVASFAGEWAGAAGISSRLAGEGKKITQAEFNRAFLAGKTKREQERQAALRDTRRTVAALDAADSADAAQVERLLSETAQAEGDDPVFAEIRDARQRMAERFIRRTLSDVEAAFKQSIQMSGLEEGLAERLDAVERVLGAFGRLSALSAGIGRARAQLQVVEALQSIRGLAGRVTAGDVEQVEALVEREELLSGRLGDLEDGPAAEEALSRGVGNLVQGFWDKLGDRAGEVMAPESPDLDGMARLIPAYRRAMESLGRFIAAENWAVFRQWLIELEMKTEEQARAEAPDREDFKAKPAVPVTLPAGKALRLTHRYSGRSVDLVFPGKVRNPDEHVRLAVVHAGSPLGLVAVSGNELSRAVAHWKKKRRPDWPAQWRTENLRRRVADQRQDIQGKMMSLREVPFEMRDATGPNGIDHVLWIFGLDLFEWMLREDSRMVVGEPDARQEEVGFGNPDLAYAYDLRIEVRREGIDEERRILSLNVRDPLDLYLPPQVVDQTKAGLEEAGEFARRVGEADVGGMTLDEALEKLHHLLSA